MDSIVASRARAVGRVAVSIVAVGAITVFYTRVVPVNPTTVALTYLVATLVIASWWGILESMIASIVAVLLFNFFFLPPTGTFTIGDSQNLVAFVAFLATAIIVSQLSGRARQRALDAAARQRDLERLYALSRSLLLSEGAGAVAPAIARHIADAFELGTVALFDQRADVVAWAGPKEVPGLDAMLREVARRATSLHQPGGPIVIAIQLGGAPIGSLALSDAGLSDTVQQSIASLAAIGLERARAREATARAEAAQQSGELRATVLDALAHEFKTPLTSMKVAAGDLRVSASASARDRELATIIDEELDRFQGLVSDAVQMLRIDAGQFAVHPERQPLAETIAAAVRQFERRLDGHQVRIDTAAGLTVDADRELLTLALRQLIDNAVKSSPPTSSIDIRGRRSDSARDAVEVTVHNSGSTVAARDQIRLFERFYRGAHAAHVPGSGMGLAIVSEIARAHGGTLTVASSDADGTAFTLTLPPGAAPK